MSIIDVQIENVLQEQKIGDKIQKNGPLNENSGLLSTNFQSSRGAVTPFIFGRGSTMGRATVNPADQSQSVVELGNGAH